MCFARLRRAVYSEDGQFAHQATCSPVPSLVWYLIDKFQSPQRQPERMAADVGKHLDRAKRFLEKNRVEDAIEAYLAVLDEMPQHQEATQALGDLYARMDQPDRAAVYYGLLFDLLVEPKDETKALAIYNRFLRTGHNQQLPERIARYAFLQQKQNHPDEAIEQYTKAAEPRGRRAVLLGAGRPARSREFFAATSSCGSGRTDGQDCACRTRVSAGRATGVGERHPGRRAQSSWPRVQTGARGAQRRTSVRTSKPAGRQCRARRSLAGTVCGIRKRRGVSHHF